MSEIEVEKRIRRLERMIFLIASILNGTVFSGPGSGEANTVFGDKLAELYALLRQAEDDGGD